MSTPKTKTRCFSKCRKQTKSECEGLTTCAYISGSKRKYCRLSRKYKMDEQCIPHLRPIAVPKKRVRTTHKRTTHFTISQEKSKSQTKKQRDNNNDDDDDNNDKDKLRVVAAKLKLSRAKHTVGKFMRAHNPHKRRARFLNSVCSDSGLCIAFGKENETIKKHFGGFIDPAYIVAPIKRIGAASANGFVNEITYNNAGYVAHTILKSSASKGSDNLLFEYLVGQYLNKKGRLFPCFLETYAWFTYLSNATWKHVKTTKNITANIFDPTVALQLQNTDGLINDTTDLAVACTQSKHLAILIQHIKGSMSISESMQKTSFVKHELLYVLYQIYMPLTAMATEFTHYDLHTGNVLLYEPSKTGYIEYHYHLPNTNDTIVSFKSQYIAKIIDYGRCFFVDKSLPSSSSSSSSNFGHTSKSIYQSICKTKECNPACGYDVGFNWTQPIQNRSTYFISSVIRNASHDLRFVCELLNVYSHTINQHNDELFVLLKSVEYGVGITNEDSKLYGTKEQTVSKLKDKKIVNVIDMHSSLKDMILENASLRENNEYFASTQRVKLGDMHIYGDGRAIRYVAAAGDGV